MVRISRRKSSWKYTGVINEKFEKSQSGRFVFKKTLFITHENNSQTTSTSCRVFRVSAVKVTFIEQLKFIFLTFCKLPVTAQRFFHPVCAQSRRDTSCDCGENIFKNINWNWIFGWIKSCYGFWKWLAQFLSFFVIFSVRAATRKRQGELAHR